MKLNLNRDEALKILARKVKLDTGIGYSGVGGL